MPIFSPFLPEKSRTLEGKTPEEETPPSALVSSAPSSPSALSSIMHTEKEEEKTKKCIKAGEEAQVISDFVFFYFLQKISHFIFF